MGLPPYIMRRRGVAEIISALGENYASLVDSKPYGTASGTFTAGAWRTRDITAVEYDPSGIVLDLTANQFTLAAGSYFIFAKASALRVGTHAVRIADDVGTELILGATGYSNPTVGGSAAFMNAASDAFVSGRITLVSETILELQHRCNSTYATNGFGISGTDPSASLDYLYASILIGKAA